MFTHGKHRQPSLPTLFHHPVSHSLFQITLRRNLLHLGGVISCEIIVSNHLPFQSSDNQMLWYSEGYDLIMSCGHVEHAVLPSIWASLILIHLMYRTLTIQNSHPLSLVQELQIHAPHLFLHYQQHLPSLCPTNPEVHMAGSNWQSRLFYIHISSRACCCSGVRATHSSVGSKRQDNVTNMYHSNGLCSTLSLCDNILVCVYLVYLGNYCANSAVQRCNAANWMMW